MDVRLAPPGSVAPPGGEDPVETSSPRWLFSLVPRASSFSEGPGERCASHLHWALLSFSLVLGLPLLVSVEERTDGWVAGQTLRQMTDGWVGRWRKHFPFGRGIWVLFFFCAGSSRNIRMEIEPEGIQDPGQPHLPIPPWLGSAPTTSTHPIFPQTQGPQPHPCLALLPIATTQTSPSMW